MQKQILLILSPPITTGPVISGLTSLVGAQVEQIIGPQEVKPILKDQAITLDLVVMPILPTLTMVPTIVLPMTLL